jgi:hypothetical protein
VGSMVVFMVAASRWFWAESTRVFFDPPSALSRPERIVGRGGRGGRTNPVGQNRTVRSYPDLAGNDRWSRHSMSAQQRLCVDQLHVGSLPYEVPQQIGVTLPIEDQNAFTWSGQS